MWGRCETGKLGVKTGVGFGPDGIFVLVAALFGISTSVLTAKSLPAFSATNESTPTALLTALGPDDTKDPAFIAKVAKTMASMKLLGEQTGRKLGDMIFDPADMPDTNGVTKMNRRQLRAAADGLARASARAKMFEPAAAGVIAEAEQKVRALGDSSGYPSFAAGLFDGFHEQMAVVKPGFVKLGSLVAAYDDAAREQVLFLLSHYDRVVRDRHGGVGFREKRYADAYDKLVGARNRSAEAARAWAQVLGQKLPGVEI